MHVPLGFQYCIWAGLEGDARVVFEFICLTTGLHGYPSDVKLDVWGAFDRNTGYVRLIDFSKVNSEGKLRFGPASADEVIPKVKEAISPGATIMSDGLRAYRTHLQPLGAVRVRVAP